jgi:hypothetical protein
MVVDDPLRAHYALLAVPPGSRFGSTSVPFLLSSPCKRCQKFGERILKPLVWVDSSTLKGVFCRNVLTKLEMREEVGS